MSRIFGESSKDKVSIIAANFFGIPEALASWVRQLKLETVARGLGFTTTQNISGKEYTNVRWNRVDEYLKEIGFATCGKRPDFIPENIFYRLAMKARNEAAEKFQAKVADEIIPSIRKHGLYATDNVIDQILDNPDFGIELLTKLKEERAARVEAERKNAILMHVNKTYTMTEIAKELGMKSAIQLNKLLAEKKIQYQVNGTWVMYSRYSDLGYEEIKQEVLDSGKVIYPILGRIPPLLSEVKVGDECRLFFY